MDRRWPATIRHRLLLGLALPLSLVLALALLIHYRHALSLADEAFDKALLNTAVALAARVEIDTDDDLEVDLPASAQAVLQADVVDVMHFAVFDELGHLVWGEPELSDCAPAAAGAAPQAVTVRCRGQVLRLLSLDRQGPLSRARVLVGETTRKREEMAAEILRSAAAFGLALWAVALATVFAVTRRVMAPLERAAAQIDARGEGEPQPLATTGLPSELQVLLTAMNGLIERLRRLGLAQRAMLADLAHQLRTPLASLGLQFSLLEQDAVASGHGDPARRAQIATALDRMRGLVDKVLALARASAEPGSLEAPAPCDLAAVAEDCADGFIDLAAGRGMSIEFELAAAPVLGRPGELRELAVNLIENALLHGGGRITVRSGALAGEGFLEVEDEGPGIAPALREHLFERYSRGAGSAGTGLGLAIVKAIADQHGARIELGTGAAGQGCRVRVWFRPVPASPA